MLSSLVQFIRNFLCCIKDLRLLHDTWLWDSSVTNQYYDFPEPLNQTTPLEAMISVVQCYVVVTGVPQAWKLFWASYGKLQRLYRLMDKAPGTAQSDTDRLINASHLKEAYLALRSMFVGFLLFFLSTAFIWLSANSWHITAAGWIGGLPALIHALTVMNMCLVPLLYYMYKDAGEQFTKASRLRLLAKELRNGTATEATIGLTTVEAVAGWSPFWCNGVALFESVDHDKEEKEMAAEKVKLQTIIDDITGATASKKKTDTEEDERTIRTRIQREKEDEVQPIIAVTLLEGYREYIYFVMNSIACYGYSLCVITYYWPDELKQPDWLRISMFHLSNEDADWHGNFAGDLMWTLEPLIVLTSPLFLNAVKRRKPQKLKSE